MAEWSDSQVNSRYPLFSNEKFASLAFVVYLSQIGIVGFGGWIDWVKMFEIRTNHLPRQMLQRRINDQ